jgi:hypothetical protein
MLISILTLTSFLACIEPPSTTTEGEPGGAAAPGAPGPGGGPPTLPGGQPDASKVPDRADGPPGDGPTPQFMQDAITDGVTLQLDLVCADCTGDLLVRIEDASTLPPILSTEKSFAAAGKGTIIVPKGIEVVVMVVDDANKNGQPTPGESIGIWTGGLLNTAEDQGLLTLEVGVVPEEPPLPPANNTPAPEAPAAPETPADEAPSDAN